jgi:ubiquinone/menaquinone biosynthesis C-methylase UbiE
MDRRSRITDSWESSSKWYDKIVGHEGHYYHEQVILPKLLKLFGNEPLKLVDLACGQGILSRHLPKNSEYLGIDISPSLVKAAQKKNTNPKHRFLTADASKPLPVREKDFSHATIILALQNIEKPDAVLKNASSLLKPDGKLFLVLSHPCFRIPRQSSWQLDAEKKIQYRRIDRYLSPLKIPIQTHPGHGKDSPSTWTYHHPLSAYTSWLKEAGFVIEQMEEWCSDKKSEGKMAKIEDRSREEFPLFLTIIAKKGH